MTDAGRSRSRRWFRNWWTAHRLRLLMQYGWCPKCNSSPPGVTCTICVGSHDYGPAISLRDRGMWAHRYVRERTSDDASTPPPYRCPCGWVPGFGATFCGSCQRPVQKTENARSQAPP